MRHMKGKRWLALLLAAVLVLSLSPLNVLAEEISAVEPAPAPVQEEPRSEEPKSEPSKAEEPKVEAPKSEEAKDETPKAEEEPSQESAPTETSKLETVPTPAPVPTAVPEQKEPDADMGMETQNPVSTDQPQLPDENQTADPQVTPSPEASVEPTPEASAEPAPDTTVEPSPEVSAEPTPETSMEPTPEASAEPSPEPSAEVTPAPVIEIEQDLYSTWYGVVNSSETGMDIPMYFQTDYPETVCTIRGIPRSVASSGCGPTSLSMVIAYLTGNTEQTPYSLFVDAFNRGLYVGAGWNHNMLTYYAGLYGVETRWIPNNGDAIIQALQEGKPVIAHMGPGIFTEHGHYVVLRGVTSGGKILVNDPVSPTKCGKAFPIQTLLTQAKGGSSFMVCWVEEEEEAAIVPAAEKETSGSDNEMPEEMIEVTPIPTQTPITLEMVRAEVTEEPFAEFAAEVITDMVNLRDAPGKGAAVVLLPKGAVVRAVEQRTMQSGTIWYGVLYEGQTLYLRGDFVEPVEMQAEEMQKLQTAILPEPEPTPEPVAQPTLAGLAAMATLMPTAEPTPEPLGPTQDGAFEGPYFAEVSGSSVNLRMLPGEESLVVCSVPEGTALCVTGEELCAADGLVWCKVIYQHQNLYMRGDMLKALN